MWCISVMLYGVWNGQLHYMEWKLLLSTGITKLLFLENLSLNVLSVSWYRLLKIGQDFFYKYRKWFWIWCGSIHYILYKLMLSLLCLFANYKDIHFYSIVIERLLSGRKIKNEGDALEVMKWFHDQGAKTVVLSSTELGSENELLGLASSVISTYLIHVEHWFYRYQLYQFRKMNCALFECTVCAVLGSKNDVVSTKGNSNECLN